MADTLIAATSILALLSTSTTLIVTLSKFAKHVREAPDKYTRLVTEMEILRDVIDECHEVVHDTQAPRHVREVLISCFDMGEKFRSMLHAFREDKHSRFPRTLMAIRLVLHDEELTNTAVTFREKAVLLRDICSEYVIGRSSFAGY